MEGKPLICCLTPVKNESWILEKFIQAASLWADYIIIADQMSTDGSREIALKYSKVKLIDNQSFNYNESERQKLLIDAARQIPSNGRKKLLITLDADEFLTADFCKHAEWEKILKAPVASIIYFSWINISPNFKTYWNGGSFGWGFIDDGKSSSKGSLIHSPRIPFPSNSSKIICSNIKVLHYQYTDWLRMQSKHRWYQCFELLNRKDLHPLSIFRIYHHMYALRENEFHTVEERWFTYYEKEGINMRTTQVEKNYRWDTEINILFQKHGKKHFACLNIWQNKQPENDPRSIFQKLIHLYLLKTQIHYNRRTSIGKCIRQIDKILKYLL